MPPYLKSKENALNFGVAKTSYTEI